MKTLAVIIVLAGAFVGGTTPAQAESVTLNLGATTTVAAGAFAH